MSSRLPSWRAASWRRTSKISGSTRSSSVMSRLLLVALDVVDDILDGADLLGFLVGDLHVVFFFEGHDQLDDVERIRTQILDERGIRGHFILADAQLLA